MTRPERNDVEPGLAPHPYSYPPAGYRPGGQVGRMQADLSARLASPGIARAAAPANEWTGERAIRFVSVAGGYLALGAAYAGTVLLTLR